MRSNGTSRRRQMGGGGVRRGDATTSQTRGTREGKGGKGHGVSMVCDKEGNGDSNKCNFNNGGRQVTAMRAMATATAMATTMATTWAIAMAMRLTGNEEGKGKRGKGNGDGNKGGG